MQQASATLTLTVTVVLVAAAAAAAVTAAATTMIVQLAESDRFANNLNKTGRQSTRGFVGFYLADECAAGYNNNNNNDNIINDDGNS